jgi:hypothetical protein
MFILVITHSLVFLIILYKQYPSCKSGLLVDHPGIRAEHADEQLFQWQHACGSHFGRFWAKILSSELMQCHGHIEFAVVQDVLTDSGIFTQCASETSVLIWSDSQRDETLIIEMKPWQVINRLPSAKIICRKACLARLVDLARAHHRELYEGYFPKTFIIPFSRSDFLEHFRANPKMFLYKPDTGSLGRGIKIILPHSNPTRIPQALGVVQEMIPSYLINNTKFDFRVYALVSSVWPLRIHVYRDGVVSFCSEDASGTSGYSLLTNITRNKEKGKQDFTKISDILPILEKDGVDLKKLWVEIDEGIVLTIIASIRHLKRSMHLFAKPCGYCRCFQIFGFDILLDKDAHPWVLEVNYQPLMNYRSGAERRMMTGIVRNAFNIACPIVPIQEVLNIRKGWDEDEWTQFISQRPDILAQVNQLRKIAEADGNFRLVWPPSNPAEKEHWKELSEKVSSLPIEIVPGYMTAPA